MRQCSSIEKLDRSILYCLELASSISILLLAFGLIASMANVLTKGAILSDNLVMQRIWAITQCCGIDASLAGTIMRTFQYHQEGERVKRWLYMLLSILLLFTAAIVLNIESVQQTLNLTLNAAYLHVFVPIEALIWIRSIASVLHIVAHAMRHVQMRKTQETLVQPAPEVPAGEQPPFVLMPEMIRHLRELLMRTTVAEEGRQQALPALKGKEEAHSQELPAPQRAETASPLEENIPGDEGKLEVNNYERVKAYLAERPKATLKEISTALVISMTTASKWRGKIRAECNQGKRKKAR
ncbi:MAG TPA: hypothetical protein VKB35_05350 [Ktedonobacteraceae bacterium]|nr:hypothetical protein [Ktedonobacteraceae bacterium]